MVLAEVGGKKGGNKLALYSPAVLPGERFGSTGIMPAQIEQRSELDQTPQRPATVVYGVDEASAGPSTVGVLVNAAEVTTG